MDKKERQKKLKDSCGRPEIMVKKISAAIIHGFETYGATYYECNDEGLRLYVVDEYNDNQTLFFPLVDKRGKKGGKKCGKLAWSDIPEEEMFKWWCYIEDVQDTPQYILQRLIDSKQGEIPMYESSFERALTADILTQDFVEELQSLPDLPKRRASRISVVRYVIDYFGLDEKDFDARRIAREIRV